MTGPRTRRFYRCLICGWESKVFGSKTRINRNDLRGAMADLERHFEEAHPDRNVWESSEVVIEG